MATLNSITDRNDEDTLTVAVEDDSETVYLQRHLDSGATFEEVRTRVLGTMRATVWFRESSPWAEVRTLVEQIETADDGEVLAECIQDLQHLGSVEGAEVL